ncbi:MAG TPA: VPLPA-CTERM sorting domain-containing protein [Gammaproteobacteria bacterium]|nr:VPLPA-CTERM sorting domain-containing protein [Gammaproteobacteria bacterium]
MKTISKTLGAVALAAITFGANAATVTFSNLADGNGAPSFFDIGTTTISGNQITIGINNFKADGASQVTVSALDTFSFTVTAPTGFKITKITYTESGKGETTNGFAAATGSITADGTPKNFLTQLFIPNTSESDWSITGSVDVANKDSIAVSIVNSLFAAAFLPTDLAYVEKTGASISVDIAPVPVPPAVWMLGSAIVGLATVGRRKSA